MKRRTIVNEAPRPLWQVVASAAGGLDARALVRGGAVYVGGRRATDAERAVAVGAKVTVVLEEGGQSVTESSTPTPLVVLAEDDEVLVVNKPAGITSQATEGRAGGNLLDAATAHVGRPMRLVHRLDRFTSGVMLFAKTAEAARRLSEAFRVGAARKRYLAVTGPGLPEGGIIDLPLSRDPTRPGRFRATRLANGVEAVTRYTRLSAGEYCVVALYPQTGRTHQLRAHLSALGYPIVGDELYGGPPGARCLLHAQAIEIDGRLFEAPLPEDIDAVVRRAGVEVPSGRW